MSGSIKNAQDWVKFVNQNGNSSEIFSFGGLFDDLDHFSEVAKAWNLDFYQIGRGPFEADLFQLGNREFLLSEARFSRSLEQNGLPPIGMRTFAIPVAPSLDLRWRGHMVGGNDLMIFPRGGELFSISNAGFHVFTYSIDEEALVAVAERMGAPEVAKILDSGIELVKAEPGAMAGLVEDCRALVASARGQRVTSNSHHAIAQRLIIVLRKSVVSKPLPPRSRLRSHALRRAREAVMDQKGLPITVSRLCREAGVSMRTLQYAFAQEFSMTPKAWLKARSLNQVRRQLLRCQFEDIKIADVANDWGFWHMGQFARDYRRQFGELPSETLAR